MINIAKILKHNVIGKLLNHYVVFVINVMIARYLGASESGIYFNELYIFNFVAFIFSIGLDYSVIALLARQPALLARLKKMLLTVVMAFAAIIFLLVFFLLPQ